MPASSWNRLAATLILAALAVPALAQDAGDDWDVREDADRSMIMATLEYADAPSLAVRCTDGELAVLIAAIPASPPPAAERGFEVTLGDRPVGGPWRRLADGAAASNGAPAIAARDLARGGMVRIAVPQAEDRWKVYQMPIPPRSAAVARVLEACGRPVTDPRDDLVRINSMDANPWARLPQGDYPQLAARNGVTAGEVMTSCIVAENNSLTDCRVESETPAGNGFGQATLTGLRAARVSTAADGTALAGRLILHFTRYRVE